jgi:hypothetical protein
MTMHGSRTTPAIEVRSGETAAIAASEQELRGLAAAEAAGHAAGIPMEETPLPERAIGDPEQTPDVLPAPPEDDG